MVVDLKFLLISNTGYAVAFLCPGCTADVEIGATGWNAQLLSGDDIVTTLRSTNKFRIFRKRQKP
jgi:hypothetical protein